MYHCMIHPSVRYVFKSEQPVILYNAILYAEVTSFINTRVRVHLPATEQAE